MNAIVINGKALSIEIQQKLTLATNELKTRYNLVPGIAVVLVGHNSASEIYVRNKIKFCNAVGVNSFEHKIPEDVTQKNLITKIELLNNDPKVHGILLQLPLPKHIEPYSIINKIIDAKDIDGFNAYNMGRLCSGHPNIIPCTALAVMRIIQSINIQLEGKKIVVIGKSNIAGKPIGQLFLHKNCTVTFVHSKTQNIIEETKTADILISAAGQAGLVKAEWVKEGAIVIDVGINRGLDDKTVGDVDFAEISKKASYITPVPGGVGPMTITCLVENTIRAACNIRNVSEPSDLANLMV